MLNPSISLQRFFKANRGPLIQKWEHYFPIYERHFNRFVGKRPRVLEIGVCHGGSLNMWSAYFGPGAPIVGVDCDERCKKFSKGNIQVMIGDQGDRDFLKSVVATQGKFDIIIDDGGHHMSQQITSFEELFPAMNPMGVYLIEDLHTSYWQEYGGGYRKAGTFIEFAKNLLDELNGFHVREEGGATAFTQSTDAMCFYDSVLVIEKRPRTKPVPRATGIPAL